jgi:CubicO group peptidase (beta-lactamase class C family)
MDITKEPYDQFMQKTVLDPMGMTSSFYTQPPSPGKLSLLATGYRENGTEVSGKFNIYPEEAPAGLWTNPTDLGKYIIETELSYQGKSSKVLSPEFTRLRVKPYMDRTAAMGVFVTMNNEVKYFQHGGANEGFRSQYFGALEGGDGVVVMVNSDKGDIMPELINSVASVYEWKDFNKATKEVRLSTAQLKSVEGKYTFQFEPGHDAFIQITATDNGITLKQMWDNEEVHLVPDSELTFFSKEKRFTLKFIKNNNGEINQVLAVDRDLWTRVNQ